MEYDRRTRHRAGQDREARLSKRQQRTTAQAASDAAERAERVLRRVNRGWQASGICGTPLEAWRASCWGELEKDLHALINKAETYSASRTMDECERAAMMARLKAKTCATEKLVGVQRSALARRQGVEDAWYRWVASNGWAERAAKSSSRADETDPIIGAGRWGHRLRDADSAGSALELLDKAWTDTRKLASTWGCNEAMGVWWGDREDDYGAKVDRAKLGLEELLYETGTDPQKKLREARGVTAALTRLKRLHDKRSMIKKGGHAKAR